MRRASTFLRHLVVTVVAVAAFLLLLARPISVRQQARSRMYALETAALKAIQTLNTAQVQYRSRYGRYARTLEELGPPAADLMSADLASGDKQGYLFTMTGTPAGYTISAVPKSFGATGSRTFYSDQTLVMREHYGPEPATVNGKEIGSARGQVERLPQAF